MPSLRGHLVFMVKLREALERDVPAVGQVVAREWPSALLGCEAPDSHYFTEQTRPDLHMLDQEDPATWPGAVDRWLDAHPDLAPGRDQPAPAAAFVVGYLSHIGLDTWAENYLGRDFPAAAKAGLPAAWFPAAVLDAAPRRDALRRLAEEPVAPRYLVDVEALRRALVPAGFREDAVKTIATGVLPAMALDDPWAQSRIQPLPGRRRADTPEERATWDADRARQTPASDAQYDALLGGALDFTIHHIRRWW